MDWAKTVRSIRQRLRLKQGAFAELVGISQTSISRIEAGLTNPSPDVADAILKLRENPKTRSVFDDFIASIEHSPYFCFLLQLEADTITVEAASSQVRERYFTDLPARIEPSRYAPLHRHIAQLMRTGFMNGRIECAVGVWNDGHDDARLWRTLYTPMRDGAESWYGYVTLIEIEQGDFDEHVAANGADALDIVSYNPDQP